MDLRKKYHILASWTEENLYYNTIISSTLRFTENLHLQEPQI